VHQSYRIGRSLVGVRTNSEAVARWLDATLSAYRSSEEISSMYSVFVAEGGPGKRYHVLYREAFVAARSFDPVDIARALLAELEGLLYEDWDEAVYVNAALARSDGVALLVPDVLVVELNEVSRQVERAGISLPAVPRLALDPDSGAPVEIPERLVDRRKALDELGRVFPAAARSADARAEQAPSSVDVVFVAMGDEPDAGALREISRASGLRRLARSVLNLKTMDHRALEALALYTERARFYETDQYHNEDASRGANVLDGLVGALEAEREGASAL
jgi:hypothetical protein